MVGYKGVGSVCKVFAVAFVFAILFSIPTSAQVASGVILGVVKDASGGVVSGATVTAHNTETNVDRTQSTGDDGAYRFAGLPVGRYDVKAEKEGFKPTTQRNVVLDVSQELVIGFALQVGASSQQVEVTGEAPVVNTTSGQLGGLVNEEKITELPLNGRNFLDLSLLQPGVTADTSFIALGGGVSGTIYSSNGAPITSNGFLLDGTPMQNIFSFNGASAPGTSLGVDGIREYKVVTNAFSAEYGMSMGSQMTIISKGGSNQFHGDIFEFLRNRVLDARNFFDTSQADCEAENPGTSCPRSPQYERNNFGAAFGGPIKKDKTFFWAVFEGLKQTKGNPVIAKGIPAQCVAEAMATTAGQFAIPNNGPTTYTVLGNHTVDSACDPAFATPTQVNQYIVPLAALYDPADTVYTQVSPESVYYGQIRIDQNISKNDTLFARYTIENSEEIVPGPGNGATSFGYKEMQDIDSSRNQYVTLGENHIFSPQLLNSWRLSFSRTNFPTTIDVGPAVDGQAVEGCSTSGALVTGACAPGGVSFIAGQPMGLSVIGAGSGSGDPTYTTMGPDLAGSNYHLQNYWSLGDDVFYTKGKHALKFGVLFNRIQLIVGEVVFARGAVDFGTGGVGQPCADALACFFENTPSQELAAVPGGVPRRHFRYQTYGFYAQDDWRATSKLTLNLGLRYEFNTTPNETNGFQTSLRNPLTDTSVTPGPFTNDPSYHNVSPRVGFAYDPTGSGKTSIRGAFGMYYDVSTIGMTMFGQVVGNPPGPNNNPLGRALNVNAGPGLAGLGWVPGFIDIPQPSPAGGGNGAWQPCLTCATPFPNPGSTTIFAGYNPLAPLGEISYHLQQPYLMQWNLTVDRQLPGAIGLTVSYVGTRGVHIWGQEEGNPCQPTGSTNGLPNWVNVDNAECPAGANNATWNNTNGTTPCVNFVADGVPVPVVSATFGADGRHNCAIGSTNQIDTHMHSWYDGLQVSLNKKLSHGLEFQASYTYSHALDTTQGQIFIYGEVRTPAAPLNYDKGNAVTNSYQNLRFNTLYHFPAWKSDSFVSKFTNGWWMGNIVSIQSGYTISPAAAGDPSLNDLAGNNGINGGYERPIYVTTSNLSYIQSGPLGTGCTAGAVLPNGYICNPNAVVYNPATVITGNPNQWFNVNMFNNPTFGTLGAVSRGSLLGPDLVNWDFSISKDTKLGFLGEAGNLEFRAELFNILNHANFITNPINGNSIIGGNGLIGGPGAGTFTVARDGRDIQLALKLFF